MSGFVFAFAAVLATQFEGSIESYRVQDAALVEQIAATDPNDRIAILELRADRDQLVRATLREIARSDEGPNANPMALAQLAGTMRALDRENTAWLKADYAAHGWVTISDHGEDASEDAFLILQHSTHDLEFMASLVEPFDDMRAVGDVEPRHYALLYDRVATLSGGAQRYGTQWSCMNGQRIQMGALEDEAAVDALRAEVGLEPLEEALASLSC